LIRPLSHIYYISLDAYIVPNLWFQTLNDFFIRRKKTQLLSFPESSSLGSPADACVEIFSEINITAEYCIKGYRAKLIDIFWPDIADFVWGDVCFCRLRFSDYHRFHFFDDGEVLNSRGRDGPLYSVDQSILDTGLWIQNKSHFMRLKTKNFGDVLWLEVGATNVGSITNHKNIGDTFSRGDEKWYFELWGSAVLIVLQKDLIQWSDMLLQKSLQKEELEVKTGDIIGQKKN
jgi:phosphatidylserine decarboxylase